MKNIICFLSGIVAGIAMCLTAAYYLPESSEEAKWGYLAGAVRKQQILTGIVSAGMTYTENGMPIIPIDFEGLCVKIPVREMTLIEWPEDEPIPRSVRVQIGRMLGATIDFIPAGVDFKERVAIGSRKAAMLQRQKRYYASGRVKPGILTHSIPRLSMHASRIARLRRLRSPTSAWPLS